MPNLTQSLSILIGEPYDVRAGLSVAVAQPLSLTADISGAVAQAYDVSATLDSLVGPARLAVLDLAVANTAELPVAADVIIGPARFANLDVRTAANGLELPTTLSMAVADAKTLTSLLQTAVAYETTFPACLSLAVAVQQSRSSCLQVNVGGEAALVLLTPTLSLAIAETYSVCPVALDVYVGSGISRAVLCDVFVLVPQRVESDFDINVKSPTLQVGASATYNADGDEVEAVLFVQDGELLYPEWIESMTATLLYRGEHDLGSIEFDASYATADGDVQAVWMHPAHIDELSVRFQGTCYNCGDVDFTVTVGQEAEASTQFSQQLLEGVDAVAPRTEYTGYGVTTRQLEAAPEEIDVVDESVLLTLLSVDFVSDTEPIEIGSGPIDYSGGGNRLLPSLNNDGTFVFQPADTLPHGIDAYQVVETAGSNLLGNTTFETPTSQTNPVPYGYQLDSSTTVTVLPALETFGDVNCLKIRAFGSGPYVGPKNFTFERVGTLPVTPGAPLTWSVLARIAWTDGTAPDIPTSIVKVDALRLIISFRDAGDAELSQRVATYDPAALVSDSLMLLQNAVSVPPGGTAGVRVSLQLESIEASDDVTLYLVGPQLEESAVATSRMVGTGPVTRQADVLRLPQAGNLEFRQGSVRIDFAASYPGLPPADSCLFDTRTGGFNGFALYHLNSGKLRFIVAGPATEMVLESASQSFTAGREYSVSVSWGSATRSIWLDGVALVESSDAVTLPVTAGTWIWLFSSAEQTDGFSGLLTALEIQREPQS